MFSGDKVNKLSLTHLKFRLQTSAMDERHSKEANYSSSDDNTHDISLPPSGEPTEPTAASYPGHIISFSKIFLCALSAYHQVLQAVSCLQVSSPNSRSHFVPRGSPVCLFPLTVPGEMNTNNSLLEEVYSWGIV
jgi:hypothetical protein